jgi:hypothetical protein
LRRDACIKGEEKERKREKERKGGWVEKRFKHHLTGLWIIVKRPLHDGSLNRTAMWVGRINRTSKRRYIGRIVFRARPNSAAIGIGLATSLAMIVSLPLTFRR